MIRATTGGVMKTYRSNLMGSFIGMNSARNTVLSQRKFNSFAEDPAAAAKAFRLRKSLMTVDSQYSICTDTHKKYETAVACLQSIDDVLCTKEGEYGYYMKTLTGTTLSMLNDPSGDARKQLSQVLDQMSQQIIQTMNQKYGDNFIFAGADGHNVPFEIRDDGKLYYRGVWVDASEPNVLKDGDNYITVNKDGQVVDPDSIPDGEKVYYLKMDNVMTLTKEELQKREDIVNNVQMPDDLTWVVGDDGAKVEYNSDGTTLEENPDGDGGYYMLADENNNPMDQLIRIEDFDDPLEYNKDGTLKGPDGEGGYYKYAVTDPDDGTVSLETISVSEYNETKRWLDNAQFLTNADGSGDYMQTDKDGNAVFYVVDGDPQTITKEDYDAQKLEYDKLQYLAKETQYVDIGYGFQEDENGKLIASSAFNAALNGINFIGWGLDEDGDPKNLYSLVQKMREVAGSVDSGTDWTTETWDEFNHLVGKFEDAISNYQTEFVDLDASTGKLTNQVNLLVDNADNLVEQISDIEDVDMVESITSFLWAEYCYNAALRVGNSILGQSLMDYLN